MDEAGLIQLIGSILLVAVTLYYAVSNHLILRENRKDRRIRSIEDKLRNFYYPLQNTSVMGMGLLYVRIMELKNLLYLADNELEKRLRKFGGLGVVETLRDNIDGKGKDNKVTEEEEYQRIMEMVEDRITKLKRELDELKG